MKSRKHGLAKIAGGYGKTSLIFPKSLTPTDTVTQRGHVCSK